MSATIPDAMFEGFPAAAFAFYAELEEPGNNSKAWFDANRARYDRDVRGPLESLLVAAADEFGTHAKVFRPNRDVRFSPDKRPYKTSISAVIALRGIEGAASYYVSLDAEGVTAGVGYGGFSREQLQAYRRAVTDDRSGDELAELVATARQHGLEVGGRTLTRGPRGVDPNHPRIELLCHTNMTLLRHHPEDEVLYTSSAAELVFDTWRDGAPIATWLTRHLTSTVPVR